jgi:NAD(P)-dependent dehydrogenase (short-subunit alcohol dehydrogenase family)
LAEEFKSSTIKVNALCIGAVDTEMLSNAFPNYKAPITSEQMAEFIFQFTCNNGRYMNGKVIPVALTTP